MAVTKGPTRHAFVRDNPPDIDLTGVEWCAPPPAGCGLPKANAIHTLPELTDDQRALAARMTGERDT